MVRKLLGIAVGVACLYGYLAYTADEKPSFSQLQHQKDEADNKKFCATTPPTDPKKGQTASDKWLVYHMVCH